LLLRTDDVLRLFVLPAVRKLDPAVIKVVLQVKCLLKVRPDQSWTTVFLRILVIEWTGVNSKPLLKGGAMSIRVGYRDVPFGNYVVLYLDGNDNSDLGGGAYGRVHDANLREAILTKIANGPTLESLSTQY
jgi:hypothetical protein